MKPQIRVFQDLESLSHAAARIFVEQAAQSLQERRRFYVSLSGGATPLRLFELLATENRGEVDWTGIHVFWDDERCVPADNAESSYGQARKVWLSRVNIPETNIHPINGELIPPKAAEEYARLLRQFASPPLEWPRFDLVFLGLGKDGHTASLFPGSSVEASQPTQAVTAKYEDRPAQRVTMTPSVFNSARMIALMASGPDKAEIVRRVLEGSDEPETYPVQRIKPKDGILIWLIDESAASLLRK